MQIHLRMWRAALHVTVRYMSQERYVSRRVTAHGAALVHGPAVHHVGHFEKNGCRATRSTAALSSLLPASRHRPRPRRARE
jgi:hypothetical protein